MGINMFGLLALSLLMGICAIFWLGRRELDTGARTVHPDTSMVLDSPSLDFENDPWDFGESRNLEDPIDNIDTVIPPLAVTVSAQAREIDVLNAKVQRYQILDVKRVHAEQKLEKLQIHLRDALMRIKQIKSQKQSGDSSPKVVAEPTAEKKQLDATLIELKVVNDRLNAAQIEIKTLKLENTKIEGLASVVCDKDRHIQQLQHSESELLTLKSQLESRNSRLAQLELQLEESKQSTEKMSPDSQASVIAELNQQIIGYKQEIEASRVTQLRHKSIARLQTKLDNRNTQITALKKELSRFQSESPFTQNTDRLEPDDLPEGDDAQSESVVVTINTDRHDDLKQIKGIGPVMERMLIDQGITTIDQVASLTGPDIDAIESTNDSFSGRIRRDNWVMQAKQIAGKSSVKYA